MIKKFLTKENIVNLSVFAVILLIAAVVRFAFINKPDGLWYDELVMYNQAVQPNLKSVLFTALTEDVHMPLYQVLLHCWAKIFSFSDFSLRSFSAFWGILTVILGFFIGKSLKSNLTGFITMGIFALNSFLIYYSQEVRMYELLAFLSAFNLLCLIKVYQNKFQNKWYFLWIISAFGLIVTYTISILYVIIEVAGYLIFKLIEKDFDKKFLISSVLLFLLNSPIIFYLLHNRQKFSGYVTGIYSDWSSLFVAVENFFSPRLVGLETNPVHYFAGFLMNFDLSSFLFVLVPVFIAVFCIFIAVKSSKFSRLLLVISMLFLAVEVAAYYFTDFKILSRYLIIILPNLLVILGSVVADKKQKLAIILISIFLLINFGYLICSKDSAFKLSRTGFLPLVKLLEENNIKDNDIIIVWNRKEVLSKYLDKKVFVFSILKDFAYKSEFVLDNESELQKLDEKGKKEFLKDYFASKTVPFNTLFLLRLMYSGMSEGQKIMITAYDFFDAYSQNEFLRIVDNNKDYNNMSYNNLITIKSLLDLRFICDKNLKYIGAVKKSPFVIYIYEK